MAGDGATHHFDGPSYPGFLIPQSLVHTISSHGFCLAQSLTPSSSPASCQLRALLDLGVNRWSDFPRRSPHKRLHFDYTSVHPLTHWRTVTSGLRRLLPALESLNNLSYLPPPLTYHPPLQLQNLQPIPK